MGSVEMRALHCVLSRDLLLALRRRGDVATALLFFVIVASLFPLGIGAEPNLLRAIAPGVIWVAALLSSHAIPETAVCSDHADGTLEQMLLGAAPLGVIVLGQGRRALARVGPAAGGDRAGHRAAVRPPGGSHPGACLIIGARHAGAQPDRRHRRGADPRTARRRRAARAAGAAPVRSGADPRRGRGRDGRRGTRRARRSSCCWQPLLVFAAAFAPWAIARRLEDFYRNEHRQWFWYASPQTFFPLAGTHRAAGAASAPRFSRLRASTWGSSSRPPTRSRARPTASSSSTCRRPGCRCSCTW